MRIVKSERVGEEQSCPGDGVLLSPAYVRGASSKAINSCVSALGQRSPEEDEGFRHEQNTREVKQPQASPGPVYAVKLSKEQSRQEGERGRSVRGKKEREGPASFGHSLLFSFLHGVLVRLFVAGFICRGV